MHDYEKVNNEIKEFINMKETRPSIIQEDNKSQSVEKNDLIKLLSDLLEIYKDIQLMLETKDFENVKDKIINSDVKNALVCESLMKILKDECSEKAEIKKKYQSEKLKIKKLEDEKQELKSKINKIESDIEYTKRSSQELSRIIKDQKNLLIATKEKAELERKSAESIKNVNKELEILRTKAYDKVKSFEKEISVLKEKLNEKDKNIKSLNTQIRDLEKDKEILNKKILNLEKINETQKRKLEGKDKSLDICNNELAKMINKDKKNEEIMEEIKEKASYYERLYKATNKQNEYLNAQLAKMINHENVDKLDKDSDLSLVTTQSKENILKSKVKKYKKKYKIHKDKEINKQNEINEVLKSIERIKIENRRLKEEKDEAIAGKNEVSETLMNKVESLMAQNREYQNMLVDKKNSKEYNNQNKIQNLKNERNQILEDLKNERNQILEDLKDERNQIRSNLKQDKEFVYSNKNNYDYINKNNDDYINKNNDYYINKNNCDYINKNNYDYINNNNDDNFNDSFKTVKEDVDSLIDLKEATRGGSNFFAPSQKIEDIKYDDVFGKFGETKVKGENDSTMFLHTTNFRRPFNLANDYEEDSDKREVIYKKERKYENPPVLSIPNNFYSTLKGNSNMLPKEKLKPDEFEDQISAESSKSVKTTSSLKDMLKKTENLQNKFQDLEKQLEEINESELPSTKKIQDQIRAYTDYYYSDYLDLSNDNDIL